jgi:L-asparagine transporter-like permease
VIRRLKGTSCWPRLIALAIGAFIDAGFFAHTSATAVQSAGPLVTLSFVIVAIG